MTYKERYSQCNTIEDLKQIVIEDTRVAIFLGANPDRIRAIENAMNERADEISRERENEE